MERRSTEKPRAHREMHQSEFRRVEAEAVQHDDTDPTPPIPPPHTGAGKMTPVASEECHEERVEVPLQRDSGSATLKVSFEVGETTLGSAFSAISPGEIKKMWTFVFVSLKRLSTLTP